MNTHDWALVAFTILAQMSVGSFVVLGIVYFFAARSAGSEEADRFLSSDPFWFWGCSPRFSTWAIRSMPSMRLATSAHPGSAGKSSSG